LEPENGNATQEWNRALDGRSDSAYRVRETARRREARTLFFLPRSTVMRIGPIAALFVLAIVETAAAQTQPLLQLQGQPYFGGSMTLHLSGAVGQPALVAYGLNPLTTPLQTGKGSWYIGGLVNLVAVGSIPMGGRIDLAFTMPPLMPALAGIPIVMQGYVPWQLSNPAIVSLDMPYFEPTAATVIASPNPSVGAAFGDRFAAGDLNDDGNVDLVVGSWFEDVQLIDEAGRVYVLWGPSFQTSAALQSPNPANIAGFGASVLIADLNKNGVDDLLIGEIVSDPPTPPDTGTIYVYMDATSLSSPSFAIQSPTTGLDAAPFGRHVVVGDFNGDDWPDVAAGIAYATVAGFAKAGMIAIYWGPNFSTHAEIVSPTLGAGDFFGSDIAVGDVNGDGIDDLVEASSRDVVGGQLNVGSVHVFIGPTLSIFTTIHNPVPTLGSSFGAYVLGVDLNDDGMDEVVTSDERNKVYVYWAPGLQTHDEIAKPPSTYVNPFGEKSFGAFLGDADVNEDGHPDLVIGDPFEKGTGRIYLGLGPHRSTFHVIADKIEPDGGLFGRSAVVVDLDGDGQPELVSGDSTADEAGLSNSGHVTVYDLEIPGS